MVIGHKRLCILDLSDKGRPMATYYEKVINKIHGSEFIVAEDERLYQIRS